MAHSQAWIRAVEASYALGDGDAVWFERVADATRPLFDEADTMGGFVLDAGSRASAALLRGAPQRFLERFERMIQAGSADAIRLALGGGAELFGTLSERLFSHLPEQGATFRGLTGSGIADCQYVVAPTGTGKLLVLAGSLRKPRGTSSRERARWTCLAAHLGAGLRLRERLASAASAGDGPEAVLEPSGRLAHAEAAAQRPDARERLRAAVVQRELARSEHTHDADAALTLWRALVGGRWSLLDRFESDGKRFVVAHRNDPELGDPRGLTRRERQVAEYVGLGRPHKQIAYTLGVSAAAVSNAVTSASRKLGLRGRTELASFFAPGGLRLRLETVDLAGATLCVGVAQGARDLGALGPLTPAERDVASELSRGASVAAIAERRGSSPLTVETQIKAIYAKLGVGSRTELAARMETAREAVAERPAPTR